MGKQFNITIYLEVKIIKIKNLDMNSVSNQNSFYIRLSIDAFKLIFLLIHY